MQRFQLTRRRFVAALAALPALHPVFGAAAPETKTYHCPPCGCQGDKLVFQAPGKCPYCGMVLLLSGDTGSAADYGKAQFPGNALQVQFPFELLANAIFLPVMVNGKGPFLFSMDTGSDNSLLASELLHEMGIRTDAAGPISQLQFGLPKGVQRSTKIAESTKMSDLWPLIGRRMYGDVGYDILQPFVVEINYAKQLITLHDPANYSYSGHGTTLPIAALWASYDPQIAGEMIVPGRGSVPVRFTIDTGAGGTIISAPLVKKYRLTEILSKTRAAGDQRVGGYQPTLRVARVPGFRIGPYAIANPVVALSNEQTGSLSTESISVNLGGSILRRFTVIIDYAHNKVTLEPNHDFGRPFESDASGLDLTASGSDFRTFTVSSVLAESPGAAAGLRPGDRIVAINDEPTRPFALWQIQDRLKKSGATVSLRIQRGSKEFARMVHLRSLV